MSQLKQLNHLKIPLQAIQSCTQDFDETNYIGKGGYGRVYKGILSWADHENKSVAVKRLDVTGFQGNKEFYTEIVTLSRYRHKNIITLLGFCDDSNEMILVYEYASYGSLDDYLGDSAKLCELSWEKRLKICSGVASALDYLHNHVAAGHRVIHRDIKSANILLDENWTAKLSDFGLSRIGLVNQLDTFLITNAAGTHGYCDPQYERTGILTKESDVYSFGVVLLEILCGRLVYVPRYHDERRFLHHYARTCYNSGKLEDIIDHRIKKHIRPQVLPMFSEIAYQCLEESREGRPTIAKVANQLETALHLQFEHSPYNSALTIQKNFRIFMMKKMIRILSYLYNAKHKVENLVTLFNDGTYYSRIANDGDERMRYNKKIIVFIVTIHAMSDPSEYVRTLKRSMLDKLERMIDVMDHPRLPKSRLITMKRKARLLLIGANQKDIIEAVTMIVQMVERESSNSKLEPSLHGAALIIQKNFRIVMMKKMIPILSYLYNAKHKLENLEILFKDGTYYSRIANDENQKMRYIKKITVLLATVNAIEDPTAYVTTLKSSIVDRLEEMIHVVQRVRSPLMQHQTQLPSCVDDQVSYKATSMSHSKSHIGSERILVLT